ncbi:MAG: DEAD/DEAH box helicase family protein [Pseudomonadota bacterium]
MTPEGKARQRIDDKLEQAGWVVQDFQLRDLGAARGVVIRDYPTDTCPADYLLFVDRERVGVIDAKADATILTFVEEQTACYGSSVLKWRVKVEPESTRQIVRFTDGSEPSFRSREIFHFFTPGQLAEWLHQPDTRRRRLKTRIPALPARNLRDCQIAAVTGQEKSLTQNKPRALVHMATGAGKTFTAITAVYRLLKFGGAFAGQLLPQDPNDEPASALLACIRAEQAARAGRGPARRTRKTTHA